MATTPKKTKKAPPITAFWDVIDRSTRLILGTKSIRVEARYRRRGAPIEITLSPKGAKTLLADLLNRGAELRTVKCADAPKHRRCYIRRNYSENSSCEFVVVEKGAGKSEREFLVSLGPTQAKRLGRELAAMAERG